MSDLRNDYVELFNRGTAAVNITGWSIQYASASGSSWDRTILSGTIVPGQYYLVQEAQGSGGSTSLPAADASGGVNFSATSGKIALVDNSSTLVGSSPNVSHIIDLVGYGNANFAEGRPAKALTNTTAAVRQSAGCADTHNNQSDFSIGTPSPRNSRSPLNPCVGSIAPQISEVGITNAASFLSGPLAPGEIVTIFGFGLGPVTLAPMQVAPDGQSVSKMLGGTRVLFDGTAAPMIYAAANQVSAVVPFSVAGRPDTAVEVEYNGLRSSKIVVPVGPSAPGIFLLNSSGQAAALNPDFTVNGPENPADKGTVVSFYVTGAGQTIPAGEDGSVTGSVLPKPILPVKVHLSGVEADVLYAGAAPGLVSGVLQVNAKIPESLAGSGSIPLSITVGSAQSQAGATIAIKSKSNEQIAQLIDRRLEQLRHDPTIVPLPEIPNDRSTVPADWLAVVSWNTQTGGTSASPGAARPPMVKAVLANLFSGTYSLLAAQEVPSSESAQVLRNLLPGGSSIWQNSFFDTTDTMDNGFWYRRSVTLREAFPLFVNTETDSSGRFLTDPSKAVHPPQVAQFQVEDFDFTLVTVHLNFADGETAASARELHGVLDYLDWYFSQPDHDPDVMVCGDFNIPSMLSGQTGRNAITLDTIFNEDPRFQVGERRFAVTVHEPTSRSPASSGGLPLSNYDHCVFSADTMKAFVQARRVTTDIMTDLPEDPELRLTSDHFPIVAFFKTRGPGISLDLKTRIRPVLSGLQPRAVALSSIGSRKVVQLPCSAGRTPMAMPGLITPPDPQCF